MGNVRSQQVSASNSARVQAEANKGAAQSSNSVPELRVVVEDNSTAIQLNTDAIQRLERLVSDLTRRVRGASSNGGGSI